MLGCVPWRSPRRALRPHSLLWACFALSSAAPPPSRSHLLPSTDRLVLGTRHYLPCCCSYHPLCWLPRAFTRALTVECCSHPAPLTGLLQATASPAVQEPWPWPCLVVGQRAGSVSGATHWPLLRATLSTPRGSPSGAAPRSLPGLAATAWLLGSAFGAAPHRLPPLLLTLVSPRGSPSRLALPPRPGREAMARPCG